MELDLVEINVSAYLRGYTCGLEARHRSMNQSDDTTERLADWVLGWYAGRTERGYRIKTGLIQANWTDAWEALCASGMVLPPRAEMMKLIDWAVAEKLEELKGGSNDRKPAASEKTTDKGPSSKMA